MALTASPHDQERLLELQASDTRLQQLDHRAKRLPEIERLAELAKDAEAARQQWLADQGVAEDIRVELGRVQADTEVVEKRLARDEERLASTSSVKEVEGLELEIESLRRRRSDLDEIQLGVMERLDQAETTAEAAKQRLDDVTSTIEQVEKERDQQLSEIGREREGAEGRRDELAAATPPELLALYERQRERYGAGASHLRGGVSSASGVKLTESDMARIRSAAPDAVILCPDSDAILVRTAESGL